MAPPRWLCAASWVILPNSPVPLSLTGERLFLEIKNSVKLKHLFLFSPIIKLPILFFSHKILLVPCQGGVEKAKGWANWNLQVSNSHFSFSTWSFVLLGFLQFGWCFSQHLQPLLFLEQKRSRNIQPCIQWVQIRVRWEKDLSGQSLVGKTIQPRKYSLSIISLNIFQFSSSSTSALTTSIRANKKMNRSLWFTNYHQVGDVFCVQQLPTHMMSEAISDLLL